MRKIVFGVPTSSVTAAAKSCATTPTSTVAECIMGTYADHVRSKEAGTNLQKSISDLFAKRLWIKTSLPVILIHVTYHRAHKEELAMTKFPVYKVRDGDRMMKL